LAALASKVYLVYRKKPLRADPVWVKRAEAEKKIEIVYETNILEILGDGQKVTNLKLDKVYQGSDQLKTDGIFIEIGGLPGVNLAKPLGVVLDEKGYIQVKPDMSTNIKGVFAAGDVANSTGEFQQIVTAVSEGAIASNSVYRFLKEKFN
jgi:thioredoxin reductase (NADPH)